MRILRARFIALMLAAFAPCCDLLGGELITHVIESEALKSNIVDLTTRREINVFLPDSYGTSDRPYPVVYWFPGGGQRTAANIQIEQIEAEFTAGRSEEAIIVFMDSMTEFGTSLFLSNDVFGDWQKHLRDEVVPFVDSTYRTHGSPESRGLMGFSLGGFTSILTPIFSPGVFGAVGANDPSVSFTSGSVRAASEYPEGYVRPTSPRPFSEFMAEFPETVQGYGETSAAISTYGQLAVTLTPNPETTLLGDLPFGITEDGIAFWK